MPHGVTDTELAVLKVLWEQGPATARKIAVAVYRDCTAAQIGTVHTMLQRLERKKLVQRDRSVHPHLFSAAASLTEIAGRELETVAEKLSDGSMAPFIIHLIQSKRLSRKEAGEIREMLKKYKPSGR